ncbi:MAG: hypothetical protein LBI42_09165 [Chitinispirillales bacterium]|jgi:hypothetical protein|nr:hypothetical protein [Chitinispirillales bacterium]
MSYYVIEKPNTSYVTEQECPYKFDNSDESFDAAVQEFIAGDETFSSPNSDLLERAVRGLSQGSV